MLSCAKSLRTTADIWKLTIAGNIHALQLHSRESSKRVLGIQHIMFKKRQKINNSNSTFYQTKLFHRANMVVISSPQTMQKVIKMKFLAGILTLSVLSCNFISTNKKRSPPPLHNIHHFALNKPRFHFLLLRTNHNLTRRIRIQTLTRRTPNPHCRSRHGK